MQQVIATVWKKVMENERNFHDNIQIFIVIYEKSRYSKSNTKLAETNAPIIIPRRLTP
jgi:hypothetical protein